MLSTGSRMVCRCFRNQSETTVNVPSLPPNIAAISSHFPKVATELVIPVESPTVLNADAVSKSSDKNGSVGFNRQRINVIVKTIPSAKLQITIACCTVPAENRFRNAPGCSPLGYATIVRNRTKIVVPFTPPPVEPGDAPKYINIQTKSRLALEKSPTFAIVKPDVREVMPIKNAITQESESPSIAFSNSELVRSKNPEVVSTALECNLNL